MDKQNVAYMYSEIWFNLKGVSDTCYNMDELKNIIPSEIDQSQKDKYYMIPLMWSI